jgi:hypothetical protein
MTSLSILIVGLLLGMKHATEADHLAAVATLATGQNSLAQTIRQGVAWGIGHTLTLALFGALVLALGKAIPEHMERALELAVGLMLVALGADVLRRLVRQRIHFHVHRHVAGGRHVHAHSHAGEGPHRLSLHRHAHLPSTARHGRRTGSAGAVSHSTGQHQRADGRGLPLRALAVGMMHGMAGTAALILLSVGAVQSFAMGLIYILVFGAGSIIGMALLSVAIAVPLRLSAGYLGWLHKGMTALVGGVSCALGASMVYQIGFVEGLLLG